MGTPVALFKQTITFGVLTGRDAYGKPALAALSTAKARVQSTRRMIRDARGNEFLATHVLYTAAPLTLNHRVWFPGTDTADFNAARRPVGIDEHVDGDGVLRFLKVWF